MDRTRAMGTAMGVIRTGVGGALLFAPRWSGRIWVGQGADDPGSLVFARAVGARDMALGAATLAALRSRQDTAARLRLGFVADLADTAATLIAAPHLDSRRRWLMPLISASVGVAGLAATRWTQEADRTEVPQTLPGEVRAKLSEEVDQGAVEQTRI